MIRLDSTWPEQPGSRLRLIVVLRLLQIGGRTYSEDLLARRQRMINDEAVEQVRDNSDDPIA